ncbi:hypothetical protein D3C86_1906010 [compost metagenome]
MYNTGSIFSGYEITRNHPESIFRVLVRQCIRQKLFVADANQVGTFKLLQYLVRNLLITCCKILKIFSSGTFKVYFVKLLANQAFR